MTLPREVIPGSCYFITRRCTQRQFLLKPDPRINDAFLYCLAVAAERFHIDVLLPCTVTNHYHSVIFDREGTYPAFIEYFHKLVARSQNALLGRTENFWSSQQTCVVRLVEIDDVISKLIYTATNPVKDHLVDKLHHWPGVNGYQALVNGWTITVNRPRHFFRVDGPLPAKATLRLGVPPELGPAATIIDALVAGVAAAEKNAASERARSGGRVLGRRTVLKQKWWDRPSSVKPEGHKLRPTVAARSVWSRIEALSRNRLFIDSYRIARQLWREGKPACFPPGTYWLRLYAGVPTEPLAAGP